MKVLKIVFINIFLYVIIGCLQNCSVFGQIQEKSIISGNSSNYKNIKDSNEELISDLLNRMTIEEKVFQLVAIYPKVGINLGLSDRLGIPRLFAGECLHGAVVDSATSFPQAIALGSTWDTELVERVGRVIAKECRAVGIHQGYAPELAIVRDPRWGRTAENFGEDPYLVSRMGVAYINGLQGKGKERFDKDHVIALAKHFVAEGEPTAGDNGAAVDISERILHEVYLRPFRAAIQEAHVGSIMPAHHSLNGIPCHANKHILVDILRNDYGFDGLVVSDNRDIRHLYDIFNVAESMQDAARLALEAQIDQESAIWESWNSRRAYGPLLVKALEEGKIPVEIVDRAVRNVLKAKFRLGLFEENISGNQGMDKYKSKDYMETVTEEIKDFDREDIDINVKKRIRLSGIPKENYAEILKCKDHDLLALEAARKALILLKNEGNLLPLDKSKLRKIAVIGPNANEIRLGGYSSQKLKYFVTVLEGIKSYLGNTVEVLFEEGCSLYNNSTEGIAKAVKIAKESDVSILVLGGSEETCKENEDRDDLNLVGAQEELVQSIAATGKPVVVVLLHGRPLSINWIAENVPAILDGWYLGQECGTALAEALFGEVNPGGKLPITVPRNVGQVPCYYNILPTGRPRRLYQSKPEPLFPFGYGLSYTTFELCDINIFPSEIHIGDTAELSMNIANTGNREGDEVVQLYIHDEFSSVVRPIKELKGFKRITVQSGQTQKVSFMISTKELEFWKDGEWIVEPGNFEIMIGSNSDNLKTVKLKVIK